jgi:hypothetical protein
MTSMLVDSVTAEIRSLAGQLVTDELVVVPVRHHSPACAWQVRRAIIERRPCAVLVEGPRDFDRFIPLLTHPQAKMPLAVYTFAGRKAQRTARSDGTRSEQRAAAFYPFCDYSPELVALREATVRGVACRFIDLEFAEQWQSVPESTARTRGRTRGQTPQADPAQSRAPGAQETSLLDEHHYEHSRRLQLLAERLGCRDHEDLWERLFEADPGSVSLPEHVAQVAAYCYLARRDFSAAELATDGTTVREAEMAWHIRDALAQRRPQDGPVLVVVGGFHAVAIPALLADPPPRPRFRLRGIESGAALISYTFGRLERLNGYAAGMTSPAWHQLVWRYLLQTRDGAAGGPGSRRKRDPDVDRPSLGSPGRAQLRGSAPREPEHPRLSATLTALLDIAHHLRTRHKMQVPVPTVIAAYAQAVQLAALRDRPAPLRSDLLDAVTSCFVKGDVDVEGALVQAAVRHTLTGSAVGTVPPGAGTPPLVNDVRERLRAQRLQIDARVRQTASLDIYRRRAHRVTSRLLHGLELLGVPFAIRTAGPDFVYGTGLGRLQERWEYLWTPATEGALVEASVLGSTLDVAVSARFGELLESYAESASKDSAAAVALLAQACVLGLHEQVERVLELVSEGIAADPSFPSVATSANQLGVLWGAREPLEVRELEGLLTEAGSEAVGSAPLVRTAFERAIYLGRELRGGEAEPTVHALVRLRELLVSEAGAGLDAELYWQMCDGLASGHDDPLVRGAATGLAYSAGRLDADDLSRAVAGHLSGTVGPREAVGFLRGLMTTAREAAWQRPQVVAALDARLSEWDHDTFIAHLPELRLAFAELTPAETDRIARAVAALHGMATAQPTAPPETVEPSPREALPEHDLRRHREVSHAVAAALARDGLASWSAQGAESSVAAAGSSLPEEVGEG